MGILDQYIVRKPIEKVKVKGFKKPVKVHITTNVCNCHPETCCHWAYTFRAKKIIWGGDYYNDFKEVTYRLKKKS